MPVISPAATWARTRHRGGRQPRHDNAPRTRTPHGCRFYIYINIRNRLESLIMVRKRMSKSLLRGLLSLALIVGWAPRCLAQGLTIAAASDLQSALPAIASQFEKETGQPVRLTFGSSGNFFSQIQNGAPFDLFLSADIDYPRRLEASGTAERGSLYQYAVGRIVLWTR